MIHVICLKKSDTKQMFFSQYSVHVNSNVIKEMLNYNTTIDWMVEYPL